MSYTKGLSVPKFETGPACATCPARMRCIGFVPPENAILEISSDGRKVLSFRPKPNLDVWFVGEAAGGDEVKTGLPFQGGAGWELNQELYESGNGTIRRNAYVTNVVKCRPIEWQGDRPYISPYSGDHKNITPSEEQQAECYDRYLKYELEQFDGKLLVTLGAIPLRWLTGQRDVSTWHGTLTRTRIGNHRVLPVYHPAYVLRVWSERNTNLCDLSRIGLYKSDDLPELSVKYDTSAAVHQLSELNPMAGVSVDIETTGDFHPDRGSISVVGFCDTIGRSYVVPHTGATQPGIKAALSRMDPIVGQYFYGFDAYWFIKKGYTITRNIRDTLTMHHTAYSEASHDLYSIQSNFAERPEPNWKTKRHYAENTPLVCARDVDMAKRAEIGLTKYLYRHGQLDLYEKLVMPLQWTSLQMRLRGVKIDHIAMTKLHLATLKYIRQRETLLRSVIGTYFNWNSPKELAKLLYDQLHLPEKLHPKTRKRTTDKEALQELYEEHPDSKILTVIMQLRKAQKLDSTYFQMSYDDKFRVYPNLKVHGTATGRLACEDPTIHNIPEGPARQIFVPDHPDWIFVMGDYVQAELLVQAWYGAEWEILRKALLQGYDYHKMVAQIFFKIPYEKVDKAQKHRAKFIDFGLIYGRGIKSIAKANKIEERIVQANVDELFQAMPGILRARQESVQQAKDKGYVETVFRRRRWLRPNEVTKIYNMRPQGTAADITNRSYVRLYEAEDADPIYLTPLTVHDSITIQCPREYARKAVARMKEIMTLPQPELAAKRIDMADGLRLRVDIKIGENWAEYNEKTNKQGLMGADEWLALNSL